MSEPHRVVKLWESQPGRSLGGCVSRHYFVIFCLQVVAEHLSVEEAAGIKDMFHMMDTNNSGKITFDELKVGLQKIGQQVPDPDVQMLMEAVSTSY